MGSSGDAQQRSVLDHARHTAFSDPGSHGDLLAVLPTDPPALSEVARNVIVHYRASGHDLPPRSRDDINARWIARTLATDQSRHALPLDVPRTPASRVQGCCRDHTLFCVAVLRHQGVPARSRVGYAGYFSDTWHHDHVVAEVWQDGRWRRFDPEVSEPMPGLATPMDIPPAALDSRGFVTAAQVWQGHRAGQRRRDIRSGRGGRPARGGRCRRPRRAGAPAAAVPRGRRSPSGSDHPPSVAVR